MSKKKKNSLSLSPLRRPAHPRLAQPQQLWPSPALPFLPSDLEAQQPSRPPEPSSRVGPLFLPLGPLHLSSLAACFPLHPRGLSLSRPSFLSLPKAAAAAQLSSKPRKRALLRLSLADSPTPPLLSPTGGTYLSASSLSSSS